MIVEITGLSAHFHPKIQPGSNFEKSKWVIDAARVPTDVVGIHITLAVRLNSNRICRKQWNTIPMLGEEKY